MAILAGLLSILGRFAGQLLNLTLGWATLLLFGKVPQSRQLLLLVIVFGSLVWVVLVVGVFVPDVGTFLIALVPTPDFIPESWIRLAMLAGALLVPLAIGVAAVTLTKKESRPTGTGLIVGVLRGYPFAAALTLILVVLIGVATVRKLRSLSRRWEDAHVPVIVKPGRYDEVLDLVRQTLAEAGLPTSTRDAGIFISGPPKLLDVIAGRTLGELVPDRLALLVRADMEVLVYPSDLAISGTRTAVARARAAIVSEMAEAPAYMTTVAEAQDFEDALEKLGPGAAEREPVRLVQHVRGLDPRLATLAVPYDEWETLYRMRLQLERDALAAGKKPFEVAETGTPVSAPRNGRSRLDMLMGVAGAGLLAVNAALVISDRRRSRGRDRR